MKRKILAVITALCMVVAMVPIAAFGQGVGTTFKVNIDNQTTFQTGNNVEYSDDGGAHWMAFNNGQAVSIESLSSIQLRVRVADPSKVTAECVMQEGSLDLGQSIYGDNGANLTLADGQSYAMKVTFKQGSDGPGGDHSGDRKIALKISEGSHLVANTTIDDRAMDPDGFFYVDSTATTHKLGFQAEFGSAISKINVNGQDCEFVKGDMDWYTVSVPDADAYDVKLSEGESEDLTIVWAYNVEAAKKLNPEHPEEVLVTNGKVSVASINGEPFPDPGVSDDAVMVRVQRGDDVVMNLIPDYGYQLGSVIINDQEFQPQGDIFTFALPNIQGNLHFAGIFVESEDTATVVSEAGVTGASIANGQNAVANGNVALSVADAPLDASVAGNAVASFDINLNQVVSKGNGSAWINEITEFENPVEVTMNLDTNIYTAGDYDVVRNHGGVLATVDSTYDAATGKLTYRSGLFSTYTLVAKDAAPSKKDAASSKLAATADNTPAAPMVFVSIIALICAAFSFCAYRKEAFK